MREYIGDRLRARAQYAGPELAELLLDAADAVDWLNEVIEELRL